MYTYKYDQKQPKLEVVNPQASGFLIKQCTSARPGMQPTL